MTAFGKLGVFTSDRFPSALEWLPRSILQCLVGRVSFPRNFIFREVGINSTATGKITGAVYVD
jgi:hypothetical protein